MSDFERLNDINQRVWNDGFTDKNLSDLELIAEDLKNGTAVFERIPYAQQSGLSKGSEILCAASVICRGCPCTESETRQIYDTDDLVGEAVIQEHLVEIWARLSGVWIENPEEYLDNLCFLQDNGSESVVYFDVLNRIVYKLISLKHYTVLRLALDRIVIHNALFPETTLKVIGFRSQKLIFPIHFMTGENISSSAVIIKVKAGVAVWQTRIFNKTIIYNENSSSRYWICGSFDGHTPGAESHGDCGGCDPGEGGEDQPQGEPYPG